MPNRGGLPRRSIVYGALIGLVVVSAAALAILVGRPPAGPVQTGEPTVGGPFELIAHTGARVRDTDFRGRYMLIFFGYSSCPDVCPLALNKISIALDRLTAQGIDIAPVQPLFITVDPARDSPEVLARYLENFHPAFIGLTGSEEALSKVARAYYVASGESMAATPDSGHEHQMGADMAERSEAAGAGDSGESPLIDHTAVIYLMGPDGKYAKHFLPSDGPEDIARVLRGILD